MHNTRSFLLGWFTELSNVYKGMVIAVFKDTFVASLSREEQKYGEKLMEDLALL